jgi:hypothetical protein
MPTPATPGLPGPIDPFTPGNIWGTDGTAGSVAGNILGISTYVLSAGFWRRVGIGMIGVLLILVGVTMLLRKPAIAVAGAIPKVV